MADEWGKEWHREPTEDRMREIEMEEGTYADDGCLGRACKYCGTVRPILSVADCCEEAETEQRKSMQETARMVMQALHPEEFGDD